MKELVQLKNEDVAVAVSPVEGGRIASLRSVHTGLEFLTQAREGRPIVVPGMAADFALGSCAGAEECLPTVGISADAEGRPAPDHGDFWQIPWIVDAAGPACLLMHAMGFSRPLQLERHIRLQGPKLDMTYCVQNFGTKPLSFLYAWHPLLAVNCGDRIILPEEVAQTRLGYSRNVRLQPLGKGVAWPHTQTSMGETVDLSVVQDTTTGIAEMLHTGRLQTGRCGL